AVPGVLRKLVAPSEVWYAALDDRTLILSLAGKSEVVRALRARPKTSKPRTADEMTALLRKQSDKDVGSFIMAEDALHPALQLILPEAVKERFEETEHITGRIVGGKDVQVLVTVKGKSSDNGKTLATAAKKALDGLGPVVAKLIPGKAQREAIEEMLKSFKIT